MTNERIRELLTRVAYAGFIDLPAWELRLIPVKHEPIISFETYQAVQRRLKETAYVPARKEINADFALRNFISCSDCEQPLRGCWSTSRNGSKHAYYLCQTKGCSEYGKSARRDFGGRAI
jgi:hypothetical protein